MRWLGWGGGWGSRVSIRDACITGENGNLSTLYSGSQSVSGLHSSFLVQANLTNGTGIPGSGVEPTTAVSMYMLVL